MSTKPIVIPVADETFSLANLALPRGLRRIRFESASSEKLKVTVVNHSVHEVAGHQQWSGNRHMASNYTIGPDFFTISSRGTL